MGTGAVAFVIIGIYLLSSIKILREYERGVIFRLGRLLPEPKGPGLFLLIPFVDKMVKVDLRTVTLNVPPQEVITKDNVPVRVNAVAYFRIVEPKAAIVQVENYMNATSQIAQTTLRSVLGKVELDSLLAERDDLVAAIRRLRAGITGLNTRGRERLLAERASQLSTAVRILASDYGFKQAIATSDTATIESVLANHGGRVKADITIATGLARFAKILEQVLTAADRKSVV